MKLTAVLTALTWTARLVSARTGHVYIIDPAHRQQSPQHGEAKALSPVPARAVLAQRAGVEDYHSADLEKPEVLEAINEFGRKTPLFGIDVEASGAYNGFILVEGVADPEADLPLLDNYTSFPLSPAPGSHATRGLWLDLAKQSLPTKFSQSSDEEVLDIITDSWKAWTPLGSEDKFYIAKSMADLQAIVTDPVISAKYSFTVYVTPPGEWGRTGDGAYQWGSYSMPGSQSPLRKRDAARPLPEAPLELEPAAQASEAASTVAQAFSEPIQALASNDTPTIPGILPQCFSTESACEEATKSCSGHGKCYKKYTDQAAKKGAANQHCYTCQCSATKQTTEDGKTKTTYWGGSACQKKDISTEFWLIALFSVGMVFLIFFAVGSIWGMGDEELPSVIGAGVSGPVKR